MGGILRLPGRRLHPVGVTLMWQMLLPAVAGIIDKLLPDPQAAADAKLKLLALQQEGRLVELDAAARVIVAEASGNWLQQSWRPLMMLTFGGLVVARWFGWAAPNLTEAEYLKLWSIVEMGIGGYVVGRSAEKIAPAIAEALKK